MSQPPSPPGRTTRITAERPAHRLDRLRTWMDAERPSTASSPSAPDEVNYLAGYWRYYGGPVGARRRPRTAIGRSS